MASKALISPTILTNKELKVTSLIFGFLTALALIIFAQNYIKYSDAGEFSIKLSLIYNFTVFASFTIFSPMIFRLYYKFPFRSEKIIAFLSMHILFALMLTIIHMFLCNIILFVMGLSSSMVFPRFLLKYLTNVIHFQMIAYGLILGWAYMVSPVKKSSKTFRLAVKKNGTTVYLNLEDIYLIEAMDHYQKFHTKDTFYISKGSLKALEIQLPKDEFLRVHRSYMVNLHHITSSKRNSIESYILLGNGMKVKIGESYKDISLT